MNKSAPHTNIHQKLSRLIYDFGQLVWKITLGEQNQVLEENRQIWKNCKNYTNCRNEIIRLIEPGVTFERGDAKIYYVSVRNEILLI